LLPAAVTANSLAPIPECTAYQNLRLLCFDGRIKGVFEQARASLPENVHHAVFMLCFMAICNRIGMDSDVDAMTITRARSPLTISPIVL